MQSDLDKLRPGLEKAIDQGRKIETLTSMEEWQFFEGWLKQAHEEIVIAVMNGDFLGNPEREAFHKGMARTLKIILETVDGFKKAKDRATKELDRRTKDEKEAEDG